MKGNFDMKDLNEFPSHILLFYYVPRRGVTLNSKVDEKTGKSIVCDLGFPYS